MIVLRIIEGPDRGKVFHLPDNEPQLIGRSSEALPTHDRTVSRRHAELTPDDGHWWIRDLKSQNGTYLNGVQIAERVRLRAGDRIRAGSTVFAFGDGDRGASDAVRLLRPEEIDAEVERTLASNEDSILMAEPEPRAAAVDHLRIIYQLTTLTTRGLEREELLRAVLDLVFDVFEPERGFIVLGDAGGEGELRTVVVKHRLIPADEDEARINVSRTIVQHAIRKSEGVLSSNAMGDPRFAAGDSVQRFHIRSAICSPIRSRDRIYGAIYIDSSIANYTFTAEQLALMNAIGQHTGLALANAELMSSKVQTERLAAIGQTVASVSHSIKNILQGLRGGADVVEMGLKKQDLKIATGGWDILKRNLDRIIALTMNMLAFSRQRTPEIDLVRLAPLLDDCASLLEGLCASKSVALIIDADPEMPPVPIDQNMMHQVFMNLMTNAVEAVDKGGAVTVRAIFHDPTPAQLAKKPGLIAFAEVRVIDNGPGITADRLRWIFEPFNTTKGSRGTGLGLAVAKRLVEDHRGRVVVESKEGKGSVFRVLLPADPLKVMDPAATADTKPDDILGPV